MNTMTWWLVTGLICGVYVLGWFTTALTITQIGEIKRGCAPGCTWQPSRDVYTASGYSQEGPRGVHTPSCNKPHLELCRASDAAIIATVWPYVVLHAMLALSEANARNREERKTAAKRPVDTDALDAVLMDEKRMLE